MSTPTRQSSRLREREGRRRERRASLRKLREQKKGLNKESSSSEGSEREESTDEDGENDSGAYFPTPPRRRDPLRVNNFTKVHNAYCKDIGLDCYEKDFIDDSSLELHHEASKQQRERARGGDRNPLGAKRQKRASRSMIVESSDSEGERVNPHILSTSSPASSEFPMKGIPVCSTPRSVPKAPKATSSCESDTSNEPHQPKRTRTSISIFPDSSSEEEDEECMERSFGGRVIKAPESDEDVTTPRRAPSNRAQSVRQKKEKERELRLKQLKQQRARQLGGKLVDEEIEEFGEEGEDSGGGGFEEEEDDDDNISFIVDDDDDDFELLDKTGNNSFTPS